MSNNNNGFGDYDPEKAGQKFAKAKINKIAPDQSNVFRVLPPFGKLREKNRLSQYWNLHYGFVKSKNGKSIPIACIAEHKYENKKKIITKHCPLCDKIYAMQNALEALKTRPDGQAASLAISKQLESMLNYGKPVSSHHYLNAMTREGAVEILRLGHKHMIALEDALKTIKSQYGIQATAVNQGLFLDFRRSGKGSDAVQTVSTYTIADRDGQGRLMPRLVESNLTAPEIERVLKEAKELTELYRVFSVEDLTLIAKGDEETIKRLFSSPTAVEEEDEGEDQKTTVDGIVADAMTNYMAQGATTAAPQTSAPAPAPAPAQAAVPAQGFYNPPPTQAAAPVSQPLSQPPVSAAPPAQAPTSNLPPLTIPTGALTTDEIIAQFSKSGQQG